MNTCSHCGKPLTHNDDENICNQCVAEVVEERRNAEPMKNTSETLKRIGSELRSLFPSVMSVDVATWEDGRVVVTLHGCGDYAKATEILRAAGFATRQKQIVEDPDTPWCNLFANDGQLEVRAFAKGLPPSCKIVIETVKVPKYQTIDTGDFIEIEQRRVLCGGEA